MTTPDSDPAARQRPGGSPGPGPADRPLAEESGTRRPARRTRQELRRLLIEAGTELLWEEGLAAGAEHLTFKRVFDRLERTDGVRVTHASVIGRIWDNQEEYQTEVLTSLAQRDIPDVDAAVGAALTDLGELDTSTPEARWRAAMEICRIAGAATLTSLAHSRMWPRWMGIWALAMVDAGSPRKQPIVEALLQAEESAEDYYEARYSLAMEALGLRIRAPFTIRQFVTSIDAYAEGCALRAGVDPTTSDRIVRPTGPDGGEQDWNLFAVGLEALVQQFVEVDPDWTP
ncbi:MAG: hypothetical protein JO368_03675 [Acidimicrobiales bacterium]|nr:hypothetical protein [Acidimicrobiales bacterium]